MNPQEKSIKFTVNDEEVEIMVDSRETLLDVLRDKLMFSGPKKGCDEAACGACAVLFNGEAVCSCTLLAMEASENCVITIEGIANDEVGKKVQEAFVENDSFQCGFCTSGQIVTVVSHLRNKEEMYDKNVIKEKMSGNICRCGAYTKIQDAIVDLNSKRGNVL